MKILKIGGNIFNQLGIEYVEKPDNLTADIKYNSIRQLVYKNLKIPTNKLKDIY